MKSASLTFAAAASLLLLGGCATVPTGPTVMALPGTGKNFEQFRRDDVECRQYAQYQLGGSDANQAALNAGVSSAAVGTVVGALAGAAIGGHQGAGIGAGTGLLFGSAAGAGAAQSSAYGTQRRYDNAYTQCMYAKGEQVSIPGARVRRQAYAPVEPAASAPPPTYYPPPPPGSPPPGAATR